VSHTAHRPYIEAVANALQAADIATTDHSAEPDDPRNGFIELDRSATAAVYGEQYARLIWDEESGWLLGWGGEDGRSDSIAPLLADVLPTPPDVVAAVQAALAVKPETVHGRPGQYREFEDEHDGFEERLAVYR
jgi:hypothetical protein